MKVVMPLADGFEEIESIAPLDIMRRAGIDVVTAYLKSNPVMGAHNIAVIADSSIDDIETSEFQAVVCPGGMPGSQNLYDDERVISLVAAIYNTGGYAAAICAAPRVLAKAGVLHNKKACCFPGTEKLFDSSTKYLSEPVVVDDRVITAKGAGTAYDFAFSLVELFAGKEKADKLATAMFYHSLS